MILGMAITFWIKTPQTKSMKELIDKLDFIKIKKFLLCKRHCQEKEKISQRWGENICRRHI